MIEYEDFDLRILEGGEGFQVSAQRGEQLTREPLELDPLQTWDLWKPKELGPGEARAMGAALFEALIRCSVRRLYDQALGLAGNDPNKGVRIRIHIDPRVRCLGRFLAVPWEILFDSHEESGKHLSLDPRTPVVRALESASRTLLPPSGRPLRILLALADPRQATGLDLEAERQAIFTALENSGATIEELRQVSPTTFQGRVRDGRFHVIHYMGHGEFAEKSEEGLLLLEGKHRSIDPLPASRFASFFEGRPMPSMVVLNACDSAALGRCFGVGPYASVAGALIGKGLPVVLAMQTAVRDRSAISFTEQLYQRIAVGESVEEAVAEGRKKLATAWPQKLDWAVPVLFDRKRPAAIIPPDPFPEIVALFLAGQFPGALRLLDGLPHPDGASDRALLYRQLCRIASTPHLPLDALQGIDQKLQRCLSSKEAGVAGIGRLALGILRLDRMEPRHVRTQGIESGQLFQELAAGRPSRQEMEIARSLGASRDACTLFNLAQIWAESE